jgi:hypothetical protein
LDGAVVATDEFIWPDESPVPCVLPETVLILEQQAQVNQLLDQYAIVFEPKPAGSARVEPMVVTLKPGFRSPPLESFRK